MWDKRLISYCSPGRRGKAEVCASSLPWGGNHAGIFMADTQTSHFLPGSVSVLRWVLFQSSPHPQLTSVLLCPFLSPALMSRHQKSCPSLRPAGLIPHTLKKLQEPVTTGWCGQYFIQEDFHNTQLTVRSSILKYI